MTVNWATAFGSIPKLFASPKDVSTGLIWMGAAVLPNSTTQSTIRVVGGTALDAGTMNVMGIG